MRLKVKKLYQEAKLPTHGHPGDAGLDFYTLDDVTFAPHSQAHVHTGLAIEIPEGHVGLFWDKSSMSFIMGLKMMGGVIDAGYRGEIILNLLNTTDKEVHIKKGHKIGQMLVQKFEHLEVEEVEDLTDTVRGHGREGSTGFY